MKNIPPADLTNEELISAMEGALNVAWMTPDGDTFYSTLRAELASRMHTPIKLAGKLLVRTHLAYHHRHGEPIEGCLVCRNRRRESPEEFDRITGDPETWAAFKAEALKNNV